MFFMAIGYYVGAGVTRANGGSLKKGRRLSHGKKQTFKKRRRLVSPPMPSVSEEQEEESGNSSNLINSGEVWKFSNVTTPIINLGFAKTGTTTVANYFKYGWGFIKKLGGFKKSPKKMRSRGLL